MSRLKPSVHPIIITIITVIVLSFLLFFLYFVLKSFDIKHIEISGDPAIVEIQKKTFIGNLLLFPTKTVIQTVLRDNPLVYSVDIKKKFPDTIEFIVQKRTPIASLITESATIGVDASGVAISDIPFTGPILRMNIPGIVMGNKITDPSVSAALQILFGTKTYLHIIEIRKNDASSIQVISQETNILIAQNSDIANVLDTLQTLITGFRIKGSMPKTVDLRFGKPVVQF